MGILAHLPDGTFCYENPAKLGPSGADKGFHSRVDPARQGARKFTG